MKTTLYNNTIETLQTQPEWKLFLDSIVDDCHVVNDDNLIAETEDGLVLLSDSQDDLRPKYASLSYKNDLIRMNITENISLSSFLRMLSLYGARIREINKNAELPHTYLVQSSDKDTGVWGFKKTNITDDHKAQTPNPEDQSVSIDVDASSLTESDNYFDEDTRYKYIYDIYGYNQKESVLYYSPLCYVYDFYKFTNSKDSANMYYINSEEIYSITKSGSDWSIAFTSETPKIWRDYQTTTSPTVIEAYSDILDIIEADSELANTKLTDVLAQILTPITDNNVPVMEKRFISASYNDYANLDSYVVIYDNKPDDVYKDGFIKFNHEEYKKDIYENVKYLNKKTCVVESADFVRTEEYIGTNTSAAKNKMYIYEVGSDSKRYVIPNSSPLNYSNLVQKSAYIEETPIYSDECGLKTQPVSVYPVKNGNDKYSLTANFEDVVGGVNKPTYEVRFDTNQYSDTNTYKNNIESYEDLIPKDVSHGKYYQVLYLYNGYVNDDKKDEILQGEFIEECYTVDDFYKVGKTVKFFSKNNSYRSYKVVSFNQREKSVLLKYFSNYRYVTLTNQTKLVETMYFNHFVNVYPIYNGVENPSNTTIETTTMYCDDLELSVFGDCVPYLVSYVRKGELKDNPSSDKDIADLDCSVFARIICYNKNTHLITVNNPIVFRDSKTPRHLVVAYQNVSPFNRPKEIIVTVDNKPIREIVDDLSEPYRNESCDIRIYTDDEYVDYVEDRNFAEDKDKRHKLIEKYMSLLNMKQQPQYKIFGLYDQKAAGNTTIRAIVNNANIGATMANGFFYFTFNEPITSVRFMSGESIILAVRFRDTTLEGGNGLFKNSFSRLRLIDGLNFPTHKWGTADFSGCGAVASINMAAFNFKITKQSTGDFGRFYLMKGLQYIESADITIEFDESLPQTVSMDISSWFMGCTNLERVRLNFKNRNVRVVCMDYAFQNCKRLRELDLSGLDFSQCKSAICAFDGCSRLENLVIDWGENSVFRNASSMFKGCKNLESFGSFDGWLYNGILANRMFEGCISAKTLSLPFKIDQYSSGMFTNCGAETLSFKYPINDYSLEMPNLQTFGTIGGFIATTNTVKLNTPNLLRSGWQKFITKLDARQQHTTIRIHTNVFKRLLKNVDYTVENGDTYLVVGRPDIRLLPYNF